MLKYRRILLKISGESLAGFHTVNLLLHFLAALTLGGVVRRTLQRPALRARFAPDPAAIPHVNVALGSLASYESLLDAATTGEAA